MDGEEKFEKLTNEQTTTLSPGQNDISSKGTTAFGLQEQTEKNTA